MCAASPQAWAAGGRHRLWRAPIGRHSTFIKLIFVKASLSEVSRSDKSPMLCMQRPSLPSQALNIFTTTHIVIMFIVFTLTNKLWVVFQQSQTDTLFNTESTLFTWSCSVIFFSSCVKHLSFLSSYIFHPLALIGLLQLHVDL